MHVRRPTFRYARFEDVRAEALGGWYAVVDADEGRSHVAQLVFLPGFRETDRPRLLVEFEAESADAREVAGEVERRSSWTGPFTSVEEARAEGLRLVG
jgi:hypothetical protein